MSDSARHRSGDLQLDEETLEWVLEELFLSAYVNHDELGTEIVPYEYATQQLVDELMVRTRAFDELTKRDAMNRAQDRHEEMEEIEA